MSDNDSEKNVEKPKVKRIMTEKQKEAFKKAQETRQRNIQERKLGKQEKLVEQKIEKLETKKEELVKKIKKPVTTPEVVSESEEETEIVVVKPKPKKKKKKIVIVEQQSDTETDEEEVIQKVKKPVPKPIESIKPIVPQTPLLSNLMFY